MSKQKISPTINAMNSLLGRFETVSRMTRCREVITAFVARGLDEKIRRIYKNRLVLVRKCIKLIKNTRRYKLTCCLDIFKLLKIQLSEDNLSDITANILDPRRNPIGKAIVCSLLKKHNRLNACRLLNKTNNSQIHVKREVWGASSRIDLRIWTKDNPNGDIVIDFEFKTGAGGETVHANTGELQTDREWDDLLAFSTSNGIEHDNVTAFFVTSSGENPANRNFISLRRNDLHKLIVEELTAYSETMEDPSVRTATDAFRWFFTSPHIH